MLDTNQM